MQFRIQLLLIIATGLLISACSQKNPPPAPLAVLDRPVQKLDVTTGRILIAPSALVVRGGLPGVFVLSTENLARFRMVRTGKFLNNRVEILSGLSGSETLLAGDLHDVHDGSPIRTPGTADTPNAPEQDARRKK